MTRFFLSVGAAALMFAVGIIILRIETFFREAVERRWPGYGWTFSFVLAFLLVVAYFYFDV